MDKPQVRIGLIGAGFMGRCHAIAFRSVGGIFDLAVEPVAEMLADVDQATAEANAAAFGYRRATGDWRALCQDPDIDIVAVTAPNALHEPIALAAIAAGKAVYCEKPLSTTVDSALRMTEAAEAAGTLTLVGFNYLRNPLVGLARDIIQAGEIGEIIGFRGRHGENYMADPDAPHTFRTQPETGGAVADLGSHVVSLARFLVGPVAEVSARCHTVHTSRPVTAGAAERTPVTVDDTTHAVVAFENGASGSVEASWVASGRTMDLSWEVTGTTGAIVFTQERLNELWLYRSGGEPGRTGFVKIEAGPEHRAYANFCPAPGHQLGFNDLKVIEVADLLTAYAAGSPCAPDFREAYEIQRTIDAMVLSSQEKTWIRV